MIIFVTVYNFKKSTFGNKMFTLNKRKFFIYLLVVCLIILPGCAAKGDSAPGINVGLHIDAVLEFVVEYPLRWKKDRRLAYGRNEGEIRWSHPEQAGTLLQVTSHFREHQTDEPELDLVLKEHPNLNDAMREQVELPAGQAWHVSSQTAQQQVELYLFLKPNRAYSLVLKTAPENFADHDILLAKIVHSFQVLAQ